MDGINENIELHPGELAVQEREDLAKDKIEATDINVL